MTPEALITALSPAAPSYKGAMGGDIKGIECYAESRTAKGLSA